MSATFRTLLALASLFGTILSRSEAFLSTDPTALSPAVYYSTPRASCTPSTTATALRMGLLDSLSQFLNKREGDFVRLEDMNEQFFGPGPAVLLYNVPDAIDDEEVLDMLSDGAPIATSKGIALERIAATDLGSDGDEVASSLVDLSLKDALEVVIQRKKSSSPASTKNAITVQAPKQDAFVIQAPAQQSPSAETGSPVAIFSGFSNTEMMASYNILGEEIYKETAGYGGPGMYLACATAVPNAMEKQLRQVLMEISGDHAEAMKQEDPE